MNSLRSIYAELQSTVSSGSGQGVSHQLKVAGCGRYDTLSKKFNLNQTLEEEVTASEGSHRINGRIAGTYFHFLQQYRHTGRLPDDLYYEEGTYDPHFESAVHSMREYQKLRPLSYFGETLGCETRFPRTSSDAAYLVETLGAPFSFRTDRLVSLSPLVAMAVGLSNDLYLEAGNYILDYKLQGAHNSIDTWNYSEGMQAKAYPAVYNLLAERNGEEPVKGILYDVMRRPSATKGATRDNLKLYLARPVPGDIDVLVAGLRLAKMMSEGDIANPFQCIGKWEPCYFLKTGQCTRK